MEDRLVLLRQTSSALLNRYGDIDAFKASFSKNLQLVCAQNIRRCFTGTAPKLNALQLAYGTENVVGWITYHLADMFDYCSIHDKPSSEQMVDLAQIILTDNPNLNAAEFLLFIFQFKAGKYGRFFGTIDPLVVTTALNDFKTYRREKLIQYRDEEEAIRKQQERDESFERSVPMPGDLNNVRDILRMKDIDTVIIGVKNE